eukprot:CAMPEP_0198708902 /NCGR_PEP_ID=MMETSP1471-20131121/1414_1 /TAXON_ID=41880 /ORGANISM="Pycnococcus provasolii, Strain RCC733" /LENGTH=73 /DNA_ID=CAMNT_0044468209 /DNA_START=256 /DNA_END=477 /DNA_ORIENTATION=+
MRRTATTELGLTSAKKGLATWYPSGSGLDADPPASSTSATRTGFPGDMAYSKHSAGSSMQYRCAVANASSEGA